MYILTDHLLKDTRRQHYKQNYGGNMNVSTGCGFGGYLSSFQYWDCTIDYILFLNIVQSGPALNLIGNGVAITIPPYI